MALYPAPLSEPTSPLGSSSILVEHHGLVEYHTAWSLQRQIHSEVAAGLRANTLLLLEHPPVFTAGRRTVDSERPRDGSSVIDVDRGGKITFHGPGQIVGYPIVRLKDPQNIVGFVRELERGLIEVCGDFALAVEPFSERSGVWVRDSHGDRKIAAIGIRVAQGVTMHGFALNVDPDLSYYERIIPCGIADAGVTSLSKELGREIETTQVLSVIEKRLVPIIERIAI